MSVSGVDVNAAEARARAQILLLNDGHPDVGWARLNLRDSAEDVLALLSLLGDLGDLRVEADTFKDVARFHKQKRDEAESLLAAREAELERARVALKRARWYVVDANWPEAPREADLAAIDAALAAADPAEAPTCTCDPEAYELGPEGQRRYFPDRYCPIHGEAPTKEET